MGTPADAAAAVIVVAAVCGVIAPEGQAFTEFAVAVAAPRVAVMDQPEAVGGALVERDQAGVERRI